MAGACRQLQKGTEVVATAAFKVDDKAVTRIAVGPEPDQPHLAVASQGNMYMLDLDPQGNVTGALSASITSVASCWESAHSAHAKLPGFEHLMQPYNI